MTDLKKPLEFFKKSAKALVKSAREGDEAAWERARRVIRDFSAPDFRLMQAQHVVAVEFGYTSWGKLRDAPAAELYRAITKVRKARRLDLPTQERVREILRFHQVDIPEDALKRPIHVLSIFPITGGISASLAVARAIARENAQKRPWAIDLGHFQGGLSEAQAAQVKATCQDEGIPFWEKRSMARYRTALKAPIALSRSYREICEAFGEPIQADTSTAG